MRRSLIVSGVFLLLALSFPSPAFATHDVYTFRYVGGGVPEIEPYCPLETRDATYSTSGACESVCPHDVCIVIVVDEMNGQDVRFWLKTDGAAAYGPEPYVHTATVEARSATVLVHWEDATIGTVTFKERL